MEGVYLEAGPYVILFAACQYCGDLLKEELAWLTNPLLPAKAG
jgi:hypothetical protein